MLILLGVAFGLFGIVVAGFLFGSFQGVLSVALTAIGIVETTRLLFARHREISWSPDGDPQAASTELVMNLLHLLFGVILAYVIFAIRLSSPDLLDAFRFQMQSVFLHRGVAGTQFSAHFAHALQQVLVVGGLTFILATLYKESGLSLTVAWVGSLWGISIVEVVRQSGGAVEPFAIGITASALAAESVGALTLGAVGLFLARGVQKYGARSREFRRILRTSLLLSGSAVGFLVFSAVLHAWVGRSFKTPLAPF